MEPQQSRQPTRPVLPCRASLMARARQELGENILVLPSFPSCHLILASERAELLISLNPGEELTGKGGQNASYPACHR